MALTMFTALRARLVAKWRKTKAGAVKGAATAIFDGVKKTIIGLVAVAVVAGVAWASVPWLPESWQSPVLAILEKFVPSRALPKNPRNKTGHVAVGPQGYGNASDIFRAAFENGSTTVNLDPVLQTPVLICHEWEASGPDDVAVLRALAAAHPRCFMVADREGGGFSVSPRVNQGDAGELIRASNGTILGYACECHSKLEVIRSALIATGTR
jgi:hypothetical protein